MSRLDPTVHVELDARLGPVDAELARRYPGPATGRQPVHTVYLPADRMHAGVVGEWRDAALAILDAHPLPAPSGEPVEPGLRDRVRRKLDREPIEDLRIDFEDGYGTPTDEVEDRVARTAATALRKVGPLPFCGLRIKSLEAPTRRRAVRTLDIFLEALDGAPPDGFVVTLPKVSAPAQVEAMALLCDRLEAAYGLPVGGLRFEVQVETPPAVLGADGTATVARMIGAARGRCTALHYGTYDYSAAIGVAAAQQSLAHPVADFAKAVMQVVAAGTGVRLSDGSTNVLPVGTPAQVRDAWLLHATLVRRSLEQGIYQGWDMHPGHLPTRYAATYGFFRQGRVAAAQRLRAYLERRSTGVLDEPATARALAGFLLRGLDCGALDADETGFDRAELEAF